MDKRTRNLHTASEIWQSSAVETIEERAAHIPALRDMGLFSNRQIAKICRVGTRRVNDAGQPTGGGGRFNPASLSGMVYLREFAIKGEPLPMTLVRSIVNDGTSLSNLCRLIEVPPVNLYRKIKE